MSFPPAIVPENELVIFLQTNEPVPYRPLFAFLAAVESLARRPDHFGALAVMEVLEIKTGTKLIKVNLEVAGFLVSLASFGLALAGELKRPSGELPESAAALCVGHGVVECNVTTSRGQIRILRDEIPAIRLLESRPVGENPQGESIELSASVAGPVLSNILDSARQLDGVEDSRLLWDGEKSTIVCQTRYGGGQARELQRQLQHLLTPQDYN